MRGCNCAPAARSWLFSAAVLLIAAAGSATPAHAQAAAAPQVGGQPGASQHRARGDLYRQVKVFDFDERPLGNFEHTPMYWRRLTGEGLPAYSAGRFDEERGHAAPPAFLLTLRGGNIGYEYVHSDVRVTPQADYLVEGYIRAEGLERAAALIACYLADEDGLRIPGSEHASRLVRSGATSAADESWQRIQIPLRVDEPRAYSLRFQFWVLQDHVLQEPEPGEVDPIIRQDVNARVWLDDLVVIRVPRARLWLSNPGGLVHPHAQEVLCLDVHNATLGTVLAEVAVLDDAGEQRHRCGFDLAPLTGEQREISLPELPAGLYQAVLRLTLVADSPDAAPPEVLAERSIRFAVLPELSGASARPSVFGVDFGPWPDGNPQGAVELVRTLACGAAKLGLPMIGRPRSPDEAGCFERARELARQLAPHQVETIGVMLPPETAGRHRSTYRFLLSDATGADDAGPVLAYFGGYLAACQLGSEASELRQAGGWSDAELRLVQRKLERYVAVPQLVVPCSVLDARPAAWLLDPNLTPQADGAGTDGPQPSAATTRIDSFWLPADLPARAFPWQLAFWFDRSHETSVVPTAGTIGAAARGSARWLSLGLNREQQASPADRLGDLARRVVLAVAVNPERLFVPAPFELSSSGGTPTWQPTEQYIPLRTLWHYLAGARAVEALALPHEGVGVLFRKEKRHMLVAWTWQPETADADVELYVGPTAAAFDLTGRQHPLSLDGAAARVRLTAMPLIIDGVNASLLLLPQGFEVDPAFVQLHETEPRPTITFRNPYPGELAGTIELQPPPGWQVNPATIRLELAPGATLQQPLELVLPPRQPAGVQELGFVFRLRHPDPVRVHLRVPLQVGLRDLSVSSRLHWEGDDLIVEHVLVNQSSTPVSFSSFCQPARRGRLEGLFLDVPSSETRVQMYRLPAARDLVGTQIWLGIRETDGPRALDQLVPVPQ